MNTRVNFGSAQPSQGGQFSVGGNSAFEAGLTLGIGGSGWNTLEQIGANAVTGGVISVLSGGKFGNGFVSAGLTCAAMPLAGNSGNVVVRSVEGALIGGTISEATGGKFANGAISGAVQGAMEEPRDLENEKQKGANADLSDDAVTRLEKEVRANFSDGKAYASAQLTAFCAAKNSGCGADTGTAAGFDATKFTWSPKHFFGNEDKASVQFTGATTDPDTKQITLYDGGIALQGNGTGKQAVAMILLHEYRHTTPFNIREWQQYKATPAYINNDVYMQRPNEIDAFAWSKKVMDYVPSH